MKKKKVFCIGYHKTGTTSLSTALRALGYNVTGPNGVHDPDIGDNVLSMAYSLVKKYDAFQDNPWPIIYKEIDAKFPGSKFILLSRDTNSWIKSVVKHFGGKETPMRNWIYGVGDPVGNKSIYIERYENHKTDVLDYFKDRPNDLLVMDFAKGDGWEVLCPFLETEIPSTPFPHVNKAADRKHETSTPSVYSTILTSVKKPIKKIIRRLK